MVEGVKGEIATTVSELQQADIDMTDLRENHEVYLGKAMLLVQLLVELDEASVEAHEMLEKLQNFPAMGKPGTQAINTLKEVGFQKGDALISPIDAGLAAASNGTMSLVTSMDALLEIYAVSGEVGMKSSEVATWVLSTRESTRKTHESTANTVQALNQYAEGL